MADELANDVIHDWDRLQADRGTWLMHWQQVANYMLPDRADYIVQRMPGAKRMQWIYDSLPVVVCEQLASGLHSRLTSPTIPWFALACEDERLNRSDRVRAWLQAASADLYGVFSDPRRNFPTHSHELYLDLASIGTGVMSVLDDAALGGPRFSTRHLKECCLAENDNDEIDQISRKWQWTAKQAYQRWGEKAGEKVVKAYLEPKKGDENKKFWFHHRVKPRRDRNAQRNDARHKPWESVWVSEEDKTVVAEGGFDEFPYVCPRLAKVSGEVYGRGRGIVELPDAKMLNELVKLVAQAAQVTVRPPLQAPDDGFIVPIRQAPGAINYYRAGLRKDDRLSAIMMGADPKIGMDMLTALRQQIKDAFYVTLMTMPTDPERPGSEGKGVTATFTVRQQNQNMQILSPMLSRLSCEQNQPLVDRVFNLRWRQSMALRFGPGSPFPPPPDELRGARLRVIYLNPIALAQRATELSSIDQLMQRQLELRQMDPAAPMVLDAEAIIRLEARDTNAPTEVIKTPQRLAYEAHATAQMQQQQHAAGVAKDVASAANQGSAAAVNLAGLQRAA